MFLASCQTAPCPLSGFDTHARWQPVTQSARSQRSYRKIGDCEQSSSEHIFFSFPTPEWMVFQLLACSRRSDSRAREKNSRRKKKKGETLSLLPPVCNLTRSPLTAVLYNWTPGTGYPVIGNVTPRSDNIRVHDAWRLPKNVCVGCYPGTRLSRNWTKRKLPFRYNSIFPFFLG